MKRKGKVCLNLYSKRKVIIENSKGLSARHLAEMFKYGRAQINVIIKHKFKKNEKKH